MLNPQLASVAKGGVCEYRLLKVKVQPAAGAQGLLATGLANTVEPFVSLGYLSVLV